MGLAALAAIGILATTPSLASKDVTELNPEEMIMYKSECVKIAWENPNTLAYGEGEPLARDVAEAWLAALERYERGYGIYYFLVPAECKTGV